jgi:hypothetical protein
MTKKDLIEFLKDYPDYTIIKILNDECIGNAYVIEECFDTSGRKAVLISGDYGDD